MGLSLHVFFIDTEHIKIIPVPNKKAQGLQKRVYLIFKYPVINSPRHQWVTYLAPSHYLNQCWLLVNWTLGSKLLWNSNQNTKLFIHKNTFATVCLSFCPGERWVKPTAFVPNQSAKWANDPMKLDSADTTNTNCQSHIIIRNVNIGRAHPHSHHKYCCAIW